MARIFPPIVPPRDPKECAPWLYRELRRISSALAQSQQGLAAITRGEVPDASGQPIIDTSKFFVKPGIVGGQTGYGGVGSGENLIFGSTANTTKGKIHLGNPTPNLTVDEAQDLVGINKSSPSATLHIVGSLSGSGSSLTPTGDIDATGTRWTPRGGGAWAGIGGTCAAAMLTDDGNTSMAAINVDTGVNPQRCTLSGTVTPGATYTIVLKYLVLTAAYTTGFIGVEMVDSNGERWVSWAGAAGGSEGAGITSVNSPPTFPAPTPTTGTTTVTLTVTCSGSGNSNGTGGTPNSINLYMGLSNGGGNLYGGVTYITIGQAGAALIQWDLSSGSQSGQIALDGKVGINTGSTAPAATLDILQGASAGVPAFKIKAEASPTIGVYQFLIVSDAGTPLVFYDSGLGDIFQAPNIVADQSFTVNNPIIGGGAGHQILSAASAISTVTLPDVGSGSDFVFTAGGQSLASKTLSTTCALVASTASSGVAFQDTTTSSKKLRMVLSGAVGNNNFVIASTAARTYTFRDLSGGVVLDSGSVLTSGRVPFVTTGGALLDSSLFLFSTGSGLTLSALNLITDTTTGMKIGTATSQKLGFWNAAPIIQPTTAVAGATRTGGGGTTLTDTDTFDGYTVAQVVKALRNTGLLA